MPASAPLPTTPTLTPREEIVPREPRPGSPQPERSRQRIADAVVVHALDAARPAFLRCFRRAQSADATLGSTKVSVELEVDPHGAVTAARTDVTDPKLAACIVAVATRLRFPAPAAPAIAQLLFLAS